MRRKLLVMLMAVCITASLVACGTGDSGDKKESSSGTAVESETGEEKETTENTVSDAEQKDDVQETSNQELTVDPEYANIQESTGFMFESNGDGTCTLTKIGDCTDNDIVIPEKSPAGDTVTMIAEYAFYGAEDINSIVIAGKTMELDTKAFQSCGIEDLTISNSSLELGENVFSYCEDLISVSMENSTLEIGTYAFYDSGDDATVTFTGCDLDMDDKAFQCCGLVTLNISGSDTVMGENTFSYCKDLTDVVIGANNIEIGTYSFYDCPAELVISYNGGSYNKESIENAK